MVSATMRNSSGTIGGDDNREVTRWHQPIKDNACEVKKKANQREL